MIIIEDGSIIENANSYIDSQYLIDYADARGITLEQDEEVLLVKAMDYLEQLEFIGIKQTKEQSLQWPRESVFIDSYYIPPQEIPKLLQDAQAVIAISIDQGHDPLSVLERAVKREKVDVLEVEYTDSASSQAIDRRIANALRKLVSGGLGISFNVRRG